MRETFNRQIERITKNVISMSNLAQNAVCNSVNALVDYNTDLAQNVIDKDAKIDDYEISIEEKCIVLQAEYQPVAIDLRYLHSISNIIIHLERIGNLSVNIAKVAKRLAKLKTPYLDKNIKELLVEMKNLVMLELLKSLAAFKDRDLKSASKLGKIDDDVDDMQKVIIKKLYTSDYSSKESTKIITNILLTSRYLERIGDHAVSISERVQYFLTGDYRVFHSDN
jgi:phosphate transport system protein